MAQHVHFNKCTKNLLPKELVESLALCRHGVSDPMEKKNIQIYRTQNT